MTNPKVAKKDFQKGVEPCNVFFLTVRSDVFGFWFLAKKETHGKVLQTCCAICANKRRFLFASTFQSALKILKTPNFCLI